MALKRNDKKVTKKDYIIVSIIFVVSILIVVFGAHWYKGYKQYNLDIPVINGYINEITEAEINNYLIENNDTVIYLSKAEDLASRTFEEKFKKLIKKYNLRDNIVYINLSKIKDEKNFFSLFNKKYSIGKRVDSYPSLIIIKGGKIVDILSSKENNLSISKIKSSLEEHEILGD